QPDFSLYLNAIAYLFYFITLAILIARWTTSMQHEIGNSAKWARLITYISIGLVILTTIANIIVVKHAQQRIRDAIYNISTAPNVSDINEMISNIMSEYVVPLNALYGLDISYVTLLCLVSIWMFLICPRESKVAGSNKKRWQIGMAVIVWLLFILYVALANLSLGIVTFVFILLLGIVTLYPAHTLSGHAEPPASLHNPEISQAEV
ncbi:hypothetical protein THASP1DRAFT_25304, partial [Thamnocephalis sphaerospora]